MKIIKVEDSTHKQIKKQALEKDMSNKDYMQYMADKVKK